MSETVIAGRYRLDRLLGRGGMSEVWLATDLELGRSVALKLLAPDADTAWFEREARAVAALAHPNVTQLYDYGEADGRPFMVLECLSGGTLEDRLHERAPLADDATYAIAAEIAAGLTHAHSRGVVHRDLKPSNVLFDEEGRAKLADFGIARLAADDGTLTEAGTVLGTAAYMSPEQAAGAPASPASDVYSFGVILHRMLTGRLPFESDDPLELVLRHRDEEPPPVTDFREDAPPLLAATVAHALAKDPRFRPQDGAALLEELGVPAGAGLTSGPPPPFETTQVMPPVPPPAPSQRRRLPLLLAALAVLGLAGGALAWEVTRPAPSPRTDIPTRPATAQPRTHSTTAATTATRPATSTTVPATTQATTTHPTTARATTTVVTSTTTATTPTTTATPATTTTPATATIGP